MNTWQFVILLASSLFLGPMIFWYVSNTNNNPVWSGTLSLVLDNGSRVPINQHGTFILPSMDCSIQGFILHSVPVGKIPFIQIYSPTSELIEPVILRGQNFYHDVASGGDIKFRFSRMVQPQSEFQMRFMTDLMIQNAPGFMKRPQRYDGGVYYESFVLLKWPKALALK